MQQHSQIIELKDRLVQALDEQLNVKDTNEVNRIISILEHTHVTREDLEKTRLGKYINDLRKRTADKELAKRAKKLIKLWRDLTVVGGGGGGSSSTPNHNNNNISALTSPFNSNSISPHGYSAHFNNNNNNNNNNVNNVGAKNGKLNITTFNDSKLTPPNHHPALLRVKNQHGRLVSPQEKNKSYGNSSLSPAALLSPVSHNNNTSKTNVSFRSQAQKNASPQPQNNNNNNNELTNGHHHHHPNHDKSPNSYQKRIVVASNGLSPGLQNSKNLAKDGISPNAYRNRRVTPPTPNSGDMASTINNHHHQQQQQQQHLSLSSSSSLSPLINNTGNKSSSAPSSQLCSPLAFTYSNESRDSFGNTTTTTTHNHHHNNNNKNNNSYSNHHHQQQQQQQQHHHHATNFDFINDEDSNSSQFSSISNDYSAKSVEDQHRKRSRKRKIEDENDTLRENFNYVNYGGRRPQSTEELIEKFNIKLDPKIMRKNDSTQFESYSASSSPVLSKDGDLKSNAKLAKNGGTFYSNRNGFHSEENSLDGFGAVVSPENKPFNNNNISPPVRSKHKKDSFAAAASWSRSKYHDDDVGEENSNEEEEEEFDEYNQSVIESPQTCDQTVKSPSSPLLTESKTSEHKKKPKWIKSISKIEQEINEIIAKLPKINPDDITFMQQLPWDTEQEDDDLANVDEVGDQAPEKADDRIATLEESQEEKTLDETDEEEYEPYEYYEDYDEEIEVEVDEDDEQEKNGDDDDENVPNLSDNEETSFSDKNRETNTLCDTTKCDNTTINLNDDDVDISVDPDRTESMSVDDGEENPTTTIAKTAAAAAASSPLSTSTTNVQHDDHTLHADAINSSLDHSNDHPDEPEKMSHETSINENNLKIDQSADVIIEEKKKTPEEEEKDDQQMLVEKNDQQQDQHDETTTTERSMASNDDENDVNKAEDLKKNQKKSSKKIIKRVVVKKRRRCIGRLKVKKSLVDRLANEQWEGYNGCYDKDGIWREWNEMTSVYVLTGGENANNHSEENVLHILPYVNCSW